MKGQGVRLRREGREREALAAGTSSSNQRVGEQKDSQGKGRMGPGTGGTLVSDCETQKVRSNVWVQCRKVSVKRRGR